MAPARHRRITGLFAVGAVALLAAVFWLLRDALGDPGAAGVVGGPAVVDPGPGGPAAATPAGPAGPAEILAPPPALTPDDVAGPARGPMPESYRRALGAIVGRVLEEDGRPVPDMPVEIAGGRLTLLQLARDARYAGEPPDLDLVAGAAVTGADGRFRIADLEPRVLGVLVVDPGGPRTLLKVLEVTPVTGADRDVGDVVLPAAATLLGRVVDRTGHGVAGARVRATDLDYPFVLTGLPVADFRPGGGLLVQPPDEAGSRPVLVVPSPAMARMADRVPIPQTVTDPRGSFVIDVRPGLATVVVDDGEHMTFAHGPVPTGPAGGRRDVGTLVMDDGVTVKGVVVTGDGEPVPGAEVRLGDVLAGLPLSAAIVQPPVLTDAEGRFEVDGLRGRTVSLAARGPGDLEHQFRMEVAVGSEPLRVVLPSRRRLEVTVTDEQGEPVGDARFYGLALVGEENAAALDEVPAFVLPSHALDDRTRAAGDGSFVIGDLDPVAWRITTRTADHALHHTEVDLSEGDAAIDVVLEAAHGLAVEVLRATDDAPVEWALVEAWSDEHHGEAPFTAGRTDATGRVRLLRLQPGAYQLRVLHPALAVTSVEVAVPEVPDVVVRLVVGGSIRGEALERGAPPVEPVLIALTREDDVEGDAAMPRLTTTLPDGTFRFDGVEPGDVQLVALERLPALHGLSFVDMFINTPLARADVTVPAEGEVSALLLLGSEYEDTETAELSGRLLVNGRPGAGWKVRVWGAIRRTATVGDDGGFDLGLVAAGEENVLSFAPSGSTLRVIEGVATERVTLEPGERRHLPVSISTGAIEGRVRSAVDGRALQGASVSALPVEGERDWFNRSETLTLDNGTFALQPVRAGAYTLRAEAPGYAAASSEPIEVRELQTVRAVELALALAFRVRGTVTLAGIPPEETPQWMYLVARDAEGERSESTRVDPETRGFTLEHLGPGTYEFHLSTGLDAEFRPVTVELQSDGQFLELVFEGEVEEPEPPGEGEER